MTQKQLARIEADLEKCKTHVQRRGAYSSPAAVSRRMAKLLSKSGMAKHVTWSMDQLTQQQQEAQGRGNRKPTHAFGFAIAYEAIRPRILFSIAEYAVKLAEGVTSC